MEPIPITVRELELSRENEKLQQQSNRRRDQIKLLHEQLNNCRRDLANALLSVANLRSQLEFERKNSVMSLDGVRPGFRK